MNDLISRYAAIEVVGAIWAFTGDVNVAKAWDQINALPSAQQKKINCAHCKKYDLHNHRCEHWNHGVSNVDWCSYAERSEDETD